MSINLINISLWFKEAIDMDRLRIIIWKAQGVPQ